MASTTVAYGATPSEVSPLLKKESRTGGRGALCLAVSVLAIMGAAAVAYSTGFATDAGALGGRFSRFSRGMDSRSFKLSTPNQLYAITSKRVPFCPVRVPSLLHPPAPNDCPHNPPCYSSVKKAFESNEDKRTDEGNEMEQNGALYDAAL